MLKLRRSGSGHKSNFSIRVSTQPNWCECEFWVVFFPYGTLLSHEVIHAKTFREIFARVAHQGIEEYEPLFFVNGSGGKRRVDLLFYPESRYHSDGQWESWRDSLVDLLLTARPRAMGLCLGPEMSKSADMKHRLVQLIHRLMSENTSLTSLTLLNISGPCDHMMKSARDVQQSLKDQYEICVKIAS